MGGNNAMRQYLALVTPALLAGGCSWIYNPSNITFKADAAHDTPADEFMQADARIDTPPPQDADPTMLAIDSVTPGTINEGAGDAGSRPALLVIHGKNLAPDATVMITGAPNVSVMSQQVSADGNWMAVLVNASEMDATPDSAAASTVPLLIAVNETGAPTPAMLGGQLTLTKLPQLTQGTSIAVSSLAPLYSKVALGNVTFTGGSTEPVIIKAVSSIALGTVTIRGGAGTTGNNNGAAGPGGCAGGTAGQTGGCSGFPGGGGGAAGNAGGGGGGNATDGGAGNGTSPGALGPKHGNAQVVNLVDTTTTSNTNQASGGGGGGGGNLLTAGGAGGGGGGTIQLDAGGNITITKIDAEGGNGGDAGSVLGGAGGGGGGAGGIVIVRSAHGTVAVSADASPGAAGAQAGGGGGGGAGGFGRVRIDASGGTLPTTTPGAHRGPMFATATPQIVTDVNPMLTMLGQPMDVLDGYDIDAMDMQHLGEPMGLTFSGGTMQIVPAMLAGYNKLCFTLQPGTRGGDLADTCIEIAYLP
jgi:hypothetical protein